MQARCSLKDLHYHTANHISKKLCSTIYLQEVEGSICVFYNFDYYDPSRQGKADEYVIVVQETSTQMSCAARNEALGAI